MSPSARLSTNRRAGRGSQSLTATLSGVSGAAIAHKLRGRGAYSRGGLCRSPLRREPCCGTATAAQSPNHLPAAACAQQPRTQSEDAQTESSGAGPHGTHERRSPGRHHARPSRLAANCRSIVWSRTVWIIVVVPSSSGLPPIARALVAVSSTNSSPPVSRQSGVMAISARSQCVPSADVVSAIAILSRVSEMDSKRIEKATLLYLR